MVRMVVNNNGLEGPVQMIYPLEIQSIFSAEELNRRIQSKGIEECDTEVLERPKREINKGLRSSED